MFFATQKVLLNLINTDYMSSNQATEPPKSKFYLSVLALLMVLFFIGSVQVTHQTETTDQQTTVSQHQTGFDPGSFIMEHIADSYEWHTATFGHTHLSLPLPVILYSETQGFQLFLSSKFHHGHANYKNFQIANQGHNKGKIVEMVDGNEIRPLDFSITKNVLSLFISLAVLLILFIGIAKAYTTRQGMAPKGAQSLLEPLILFIRDDIAKASIGHKKYEKYTPYLLSVFFFIFLNNLLGLVPIFPGGANLTGNIAVTMVLAVFTFIITTINGNKNYWTHIFWGPNPWWLNVTIMPIVEILGIFIKPFVLMVRLFANITAGHIIALGFISLIFIFGNINPFAGYGISIVSMLFSVFMTLLELLVAFIQAYVFTLLSAIYFGMATEEHH